MIGWRTRFLGLMERFWDADNMFFFQCFRKFRALLGVDATPQQIAAGLASGLMIGVVPKDNLLAFVLFILVASFRISLPTLFFAAFVGSWIAAFFESRLNQVGEAILTSPALLPYWAYLYHLPLMPWTNFNHTQVMGGLVVGTVGWYPLYRFSIWLQSRAEPLWNWLKHSWCFRWLHQGDDLIQNWAESRVWNFRWLLMFFSVTESQDET